MKETDTVVRLGARRIRRSSRRSAGKLGRDHGDLRELRDTDLRAQSQIDGHALQVTSSIGLANYPNDGTDAETLLANAEAAMYRAKEMGRDNFQFYTPALNTRVHEKFQFHEELRNAITREEFFLLFQPQVDLRTGRIFAVEALIRWNHPSLGVVHPTVSFRSRKNRGLSLRSATGRCVPPAGRTRRGRTPDSPRSTSASTSRRRQFRDRNWVHRIVDALQESGLEAKYLELELTESLIIQDVDQAIATMNELQRLGVQFRSTISAPAIRASAP